MRQQPLSFANRFRGRQLAAFVREQKFAVALGLMFASLLAYKAANLYYPDLAFTYPFISYDGFQWVADGLHYAGYDTPVAYRNPGLPLLIALLATAGVENLLPTLNLKFLAKTLHFSV